MLFNKATVALNLHDIVFAEDTNKVMDVQQFYCKSSNLIDGSNINSKHYLVLREHGDFTRIYNKELSIVTDRESRTPSLHLECNGDARNVKILINKDIFTHSDHLCQFIALEDSKNIVKSD